MDKINKMLDLLKTLKRNEQKRVKLRDQTDLAKVKKRSAQLNDLAVDDEKLKYELHALAVELGFAEKRESYDWVELDTGWHKQRYKPREPFEGE